MVYESLSEAIDESNYEQMFNTEDDDYDDYDETIQDDDFSDSDGDEDDW